MTYAYAPHVPRLHPRVSRTILAAANGYRRDWRAVEEGAKWGAAFGIALGLVFPTERWRRVRLR